MAVLYANNATSRLSASITNVATSFSVTAGHGVRFPVISGGDYFYLTLMDTSGNLEVVKVTATVTDTFTVVRGQEGTTARAYSVNDFVELRITKAMLDDFKTDAQTGYLPLVGGTLTGAYLDFSNSSPSLRITSGPGTFFIGDDDIVNLGSGAVVATPSSRIASGVAILSTYAYGTSQGDNRTHFGYYTGTSYVNYIRGAATYFDSSTLQVAGNQVLHAGNYNGYAPTLTGTGASGSWGISVTGSSASTTGNAATATALQTARTIGGVSFNGTANINLPGVNAAGNQNTTGTAAGLTDNSSWMLSRGSVAAASVDTATANGFYTQNNVGDSQGLLVFNAGGSLGPLQMTFTYGGLMQFRGKTDSTTWTAWKTVLTSANYTSYSPSLTGSGASGSWGISVTGSAGSVAWSGVSGKPTTIAGYGITDVATSHTHSYLPLTGGTLSGGLQVGYGGGDLTIRATALNDLGDLVWANYAGTEVHRLWDGSSGLQYRKDGGTGYLLVHAGNFSSYSPSLSGSYANPSWITSLDASKLTGTLDNARVNGGTYSINISGTAATATSAPNYLPLSGGTLTGALVIGDTTTTTITDQSNYSNPLIIQRSSNAGKGAVILRGSDGIGTAIEFGRSNAAAHWGTYFEFLVHNDNTTEATSTLSRKLTVNATVVNALVSLQQSGNQVLHAGNYNSYSPTLTGTGASGTWGIRITGFANAGSPRLYSTDSSYSYDGANPYYGYLTYNGPANRWRFKVSPATPDAVEVAYADAAGSISGYNNPTTAATANTIAYRDGNGDVTVRELVMTQVAQNFTPSSLVAIYPTTNQAVKVNASGARTFLDVPTRGGTDASGTWGISVTGSSNSTTYVSSPDGDRIAGNKLPTSNPRSVRFDFSGASYVGGSGNYAGVMTYAPWDGTSASTGDSSYQLAFANQSGVNASGPAQLLLRNGINSTWNSWQTILSSSNYSSYAIPLSGGVNLSGAFGLNDYKLYLRTNGDTNHYLWNADDDWEELVAYSGTGFRVKASTGASLATFSTSQINFGVDLQLNGNYLRLDQSGTRSWNMRATGGNLDLNSGDGSGSFRYNGYPVLTSSTYNNYALPLTGGNQTLRFDTAVNGEHITFQNQTSGGAIQLGFQQNDADGLHHRAYFKFYKSAAGMAAGVFDIVIRSAGGGTSADYFRLQAGSAPVWAGSTMLTASNYSSYALPLSGGSITGTTTFVSNLGATSGSLSSPALQVYCTGGNSAFMSFHRSGAYAVNMGLDSDNVLRIGGWSASANRLQMDMSGNLTMAGNVTAYSDERLKKDWAPVQSNFVEALASIKSGTYTRIDSEERQAGVSAQDFQKILPETISTDNEGTLSLAYGNAALVSAVELAKKIVEQEKRIAHLESLISKLIGD